MGSEGPADGVEQGGGGVSPEHQSLKSETRRSAADQVALVLATGCGLGYAPKAPGTFGSLLGLPLVWMIEGMKTSPMAYGVFAVLFCLVGVPICSRGATLFGREDPPQVVFDEIAAFPIVFACTALTPLSAVLGFVWFRVFDIIKPWPIRRFERLPRGWGTMADDLVAGAFACGTLWVSVWLIESITV